MLKTLNVGKDLQDPSLNPLSTKEIYNLRHECSDKRYTLSDIQSALQKGVENNRNRQKTEMGPEYIAIIKGGEITLRQDRTKPETALLKTAFQNRQAQK